MPKAVLLSVQPKWCELIASGKKTVEVRKTKPKLLTPFKCYIYQTRKTWVYNIYSRIADWQGKVIGEFVCDFFDEFEPSPKSVKFRRFRALGDTRLTLREIIEYLNGQKGYGWHISDLVIYDKPKKLSVFRKPCVNEVYCESCAMYNNFYDSCGNKALRLQRPPQSWCYVEV